MQSDGAFIVAPPSRHLSGKSYRWFKGKAPGARSLARLPKAWLDHLTPAPAHASVPASPATGMVAEGQRNSYLTSRAGALQNAGLSPEAILGALIKENEARCSPPLEVTEVERIAASVGRYPAGVPGGDEAEVVMNSVLNQRFAGGAHLLRASDGQFWSYDGKRWAPITPTGSLRRDSHRGAGHAGAPRANGIADEAGADLA